MKSNLPVTGRNMDYPGDANILSTTDLTSAITYANDDFVSISGFSREELIGQHHNLVRHPDMPPLAFEQMWQTLKRGRSWMGLVKNRCKNGDHYWVSAFVTPITSQGQTVEYQSVRTKPAAAHVEAAERMYAQLRSGRTSWLQRLPVPRLEWQLWGGMSLAFAVAMAAHWLLPLSNILTLALSSALSAAVVFPLLRPFERLRRRAKAVADNPLSQQLYTGRRMVSGKSSLPC